MPANSSNQDVWWWQSRARAFGYDALGWMLSAYEGTAERLPTERLPWAVDNGLYVRATKRMFWDEAVYYAGLDRLLDHAARIGHPPLFVAVPDSWGDRDETLRRWDEHAPRLMGRDVTLAMVVQDGMTGDDLPSEAGAVFVGGSDEWRWGAMPLWRSLTGWLHIGRINGTPGLRAAQAAGADSCDGTGWFRQRGRGCTSARDELGRYLDEQHRSRNPAWGPERARNLSVHAGAVDPAPARPVR